MCDICGQSPCATRCPNNPNYGKGEYIYKCRQCDKGIYYGDKLAFIGSECYCEECLNNFDVRDWLELCNTYMETAE